MTKALIFKRKGFFMQEIFVLLLHTCQRIVGSLCIYHYFIEDFLWNIV